MLGRASASLFAREGARVAVSDFVVETAEETVAGISSDGGEALALRADVTREDEVREAVAATLGQWGRIDCLFNNAGIMPHEDVSVLDMEDEVWSRVYDTNVRGTALCCKHAIPHILEAGGGAVANMSSFVHAVGSTKPQDAYTASRGAVVSMTRSLAVQFGRRGVRVNALCPGPIDTEHVRKKLFRRGRARKAPRPHPARALRGARRRRGARPVPVVRRRRLDHRPGYTPRRRYLLPLPLRSKPFVPFPCVPDDNPHRPGGAPL